MALRTSWMSTLLTMSNEFSCAMAFLSLMFMRGPGTDWPQSPAGLAGATVSVSHVSPKTKQPEEVFRGGGGDFFVGNLQQTGKRMGSAGHEGGFVALAALGSGSQPGSVGLDQNPIQWDAGGHVTKRLGLGIGEISGKGDQEPKVK